MLKNLLVVGDWFVDDYWIVQPHRSDSASRAGDSHTLALHRPEANVRMLCGAGLVASLLTMARDQETPLYHVTGLGAWHPEDTKHLVQMLDPRTMGGDTPYRVDIPKPKTGRTPPQNAELVPLFGTDDASPIRLAPGQEVGTPRVFRVFKRTSEETTKLVERIDWEVDLGSLATSEADEIVASLSQDRWSTAMAKGKTAESLKDVEAVIVKEQGHGLVTEDFTSALVAKGGNGVPWFICSKDWCPGWFKGLAGAKVELIVIQNEGARRAHYWDDPKTYDDPPKGQVNRWLVQGGVPTRRALLALNSLRGKYPALEHATILISPTRNSMILSVKPGETEDLYTYVGREDDAPLSFAPRMSVLFAALSHYRLKDASAEWHDILKKGILFANRWVALEAERFKSIDQWQGNWVTLGHTADPNEATAIGNSGHWIDKNQPLELKLKSKMEEHAPPGEPSDRVLSEREITDRLDFKKRINWRSLEDEWRLQAQAYALWPAFAVDEKGERYKNGLVEIEGFGIIKKTSGEGEIERYLDLWRPCTEIDGCIACIRKKREFIVALNDHIEAFQKHGGDHNSKAFYVCDDPGGGKSSLVRELARARNLQFLSFNVTEMTRMEDLVGAFDQIVTAQAQNKDQSLLVFVDEINADLENHSVYSSFLAPLEDGHFSRDGKRFRIMPCIWVFVGTTDIANPHSYDHKGPGKILQSIFDSPWPDAEKKQDIYVPDNFVAFNAPDIWEQYKSECGRLRGKQEQSNQFGHNAQDRARKISDFSSRLAEPPFVLNATDVPEEERKQIAVLLQRGRGLERVYIGAKTLKSLYPDVRYVSKKVLASFGMLPDSMSLREIRHELEQCNLIQRGVVMWENLPDHYRNKLRGHVWTCATGQTGQELDHWAVKLGLLGQLVKDEKEDLVELVLERKN